MSEKINQIKENANVTEGDIENLAAKRRAGQKVLDLIADADIKTAEQADWDDFQVEEDELEGSGNRVTMISQEMVDDLEAA